MTYDRKTFFDAVRASLFGGTLTQGQVDGMEAIISFAEKRGSHIKHLGYDLSTAFHEADRLRTMEEYASGAAYEGRRDLGNTQPGDGKRFKGRGFVQLTGRSNYAYWANHLGIDLLREPDLVKNRAIAARVLVEGSEIGTFTGKKLSDYFTATTSDPVNARRIINGTDKAALIAGYYTKFLDALLKAERQDAPSHPDICPTCGQPWPHAA